MKRKFACWILLLLLITSMVALSFNIQSVTAIETICIRPDGTIDPSSAPIQRDGDIYTLTGDIEMTPDSNGIVIEKDNVVLDGAGYTLNCSGGYAASVGVCGGNNVTFRNMVISDCVEAFRLSGASHNRILRNAITRCFIGIYLIHSARYNVVCENTILHTDHAVYIEGSSNNSIIGNNLSEAAPWMGATALTIVRGSSNNTISGNNIADNEYGIWLEDSMNNRLYHNNFIDNTHQAYAEYTNTWDDGYPSGGNYWSDYEARYPGAQELDGSGIWDTPYEIDENNVDSYPLRDPWIWSPAPEPDFEISVLPPRQSASREDSAEYTMTVTSVNDFQSEVSLYVLACYADLGIEFYPSKVTPPPSGTIESTLTITTTDVTPLWTFEIEIWATGGGIAKSFTVTLSVEISLEVPYQHQGNTMWCGPASLAMVLRYFGKEFHSWVYAEDRGLPTSGQTYINTLPGGLRDYVEENYPELEPEVGYYGLLEKHIMYNDIRSDISDGLPVILNVGSPPIHQRGHFVVVIGFNETGFFLNDPSGALFMDIMQPPTSRPSYNHAYLDWVELGTYIATWPLASTMTLNGPPHPELRYGTTYITNRFVTHICFYQPGDTALTKEHYALLLDMGLNWYHNDSGHLELDPVIDKRCDSLFSQVIVSNSRKTSQSFTAFCRILAPNNVVYPLGAIETGIIPAFSQKDVGVYWNVHDLDDLLLKGGPYYLELDLVDSNGLSVDHFKTSPFFWEKAQSVKLKEKQHHLYLHVYDEEGNHVGLNYVTNQTELDIPGSYYHDNRNGTTIIVLPQIIDLTIVVDARFAEDPVEAFNLTVTVHTDLGVFSQTCLGNITVGTSQTFRTEASETGQELYMDVDVDIDPNTLNLKSNGEWIMAYMELPEGYNVEDIDVSTIMLNNTIRVDLDAPTQIGDYDLDGITDLMVKFDRVSINESLGAIDYSEQTPRRCSVTIAITGKVSDVKFQGLDTIEVLGR